jgi:hypothetical protein
MGYLARATDFLSDNEIITNTSEALRNSDAADLAVAYWGANAIETLGLRRIAGPVRILCDAYSGACNPDVLEQLLEMENVHLRTRDGLHAKVFMTSTSLIVGSANASANGLGQEAGEAGKFEAAAVLTYQRCIDKARGWFESMWKVRVRQRPR